MRERLTNSFLRGKHNQPITHTERNLMTEYDYNNLPESLGEVHPIPAALLFEGYEALQEVMGSDLVKAQEMRIAYVYNRKQELSADTFAGPRNKSYGGAGDDIVIQLTVRITDSRYFGGGRQEIPKLEALETSIKDFDRMAEKKRLEAEIANAEAARLDAEAKIARKREELAKLGIK